MLAFNSTLPADLLALGNALGHLDERLDEHSRRELTTLAHGRSLTELAKALYIAADPAAIHAAAELLAANEGGCACSGDEPPEPTSGQIDEASARLAHEALAPFMRNPAWRARVQALHAAIG
jgi:hypothetical protein